MYNIDNHIEIHGRIVRDFSVEQTASGIDKVEFTVAVDRRRKKDGDKTDFFSCVAFGESAKNLSLYFYKGKPIRVAGSMECNPYEGKDGVKRYPWKIVVDAWGFDLNDSKSGSGSAPVSNSDIPDSWEQAEEDNPF